MEFKICKSLAMCTPLLGLAACNGFKEVNADPYASVYDLEIIGTTPDGIDIDYGLISGVLKSLQGAESAVGSVFASLTYEGVCNDYQVTIDLTHDIYAAYFVNNASGFATSSPTYGYNDGWSEKRWEHFYDNRTVEECSQLIKTFWFCGKEHYHNVFYITCIYYAFLISMQTDTYGAIPLKYYVEDIIPTDEKVKYTDQKDIYDVISKMFDQVITTLHNTPSTVRHSLGEDNKCFGGDKDKRLRFTNTLRLRSALHVSNVDLQLAKEQGEKAMTDPAGLMQDDDDSMRQTPKYLYITGGNENIYILLYNWSANVVLSKEVKRAYKE